MKLSEADAELFFKLMHRLQLHANRKLNLFPGVHTVNEFKALPRTGMVKIRDALWQEPALIDDYVAQNPDGLSEAELAIVAKWKRFVSGNFYIYRLLKQHAIFLGENSEAYAVLALNDPFEVVTHGRPLPVRVQTVLLPFKGKIVYDGLLGLYNITFGPGIRRRFNDAHMTAKQRGRIVETLEPETAPQPVRRTPDRPGPEWTLTLDNILEKGAKLKGGMPVHRAALKVLLSSARLARAAVEDPDDVEPLYKADRAVSTALARWRRTLERAWSS